MSNLDPDVKEKWVAALRSGDYQQCRNELRNPISGGMCCIGVLGAIQGEPLHLMDYRSLCSIADHHKHAGLNADDLADLARKNDAGWTFHEIAADIDKRL